MASSEVLHKQLQQVQELRAYPRALGAIAGFCKGGIQHCSYGLGEAQKGRPLWGTEWLGAQRQGHA